jgi:8-oxo-dGTP pyrophosphatase MutT (NUDIX family)
MSFAEWINQLKQKCAEPLPGLTAHQKLAPYRQLPEVDVLELQRTTFRKAAVSVLLFPQNNTYCFSLIQRPDYEGVHGGQISFPGGKLEGDETFLEAALREMEEEIGVQRQTVEIIGALTEVFIPPSKMYVLPYLCYVPHTPQFQLNSREVAEIISVKIEDILHSERIKTTTLIVGKGTSNAINLEVPYFDLNNKIVWGATAVILSELKDILEKD